MPQLELFTNQPTGTVTSGGTTNSPTDDSFTVTVPTYAFPAASSSLLPETVFRIVDTAAISEIMLVTTAPGGTGSGQSWTVTRGAEGTSPIAHAANWTCQQIVSAGTLDGFKQASQASASTITISNSSTETVMASYTPGTGEIVTGTCYDVNASGTFGLTTSAIATLQWTLYSGGSGSVGGAFTSSGSTILAQLITGSTTTTNQCPPLATTTGTTSTVGTTVTTGTAPGPWLAVQRVEAGTSFDVNGTIIWYSTTSAVATLSFDWMVRGLNTGLVPTFQMTGINTSAAVVTGLTDTNAMILTCKWGTAATSNALTCIGPLVFREG